MDQKDNNLLSALSRINHLEPKLDPGFADLVVSKLGEKQVRKKKVIRFELSILVPAVAAVCLLASLLLTRAHSPMGIEISVPADSVLHAASREIQDPRLIQASNTALSIGFQIFGGFAFLLCGLAGGAAVLGSTLRITKFAGFAGAGLALILSAALALQAIFPAMF